MKPMSWIMWPPLTASASSVSAASAAACWSGSLASVTPPSVHIGRPYQCSRLEYTARWSGHAKTSTMVRMSSASPAQPMAMYGAPSRLSWAITRPASTPALTTTVEPSTVIGATVPAVQTGL